jgi:elongation factor Ts
MAITAEQVKSLRDRTGAGMMECKTALTEAQGDLEQAIDILRKRGLAQAAKWAGRSASQGAVGIHLDSDRRRGVMIEVNCETDFVARTEEFRALVDQATRLLAEAPASADHEALTAPDGPIGKLVAAAAVTTKENINAPRSARLTGDYVASYSHLGKIGVLVALAGVDGQAVSSESVRTFATEIAMQIAAANPLYVSRDDVPAEAVEKEREIYRAQLQDAKKPVAVVEKIVDGKLGSYYEQVALVEQPTIRDPKVKVSQTVTEISKAIGQPVRVAAFARFKVGDRS